MAVYGMKTSNIMDIPLSIESVVTPYLGDNGYTFEGLNTVRVLSVANGSLSTYDETSATAPFGSATLVAPAEQVLTLAYNKSMLMRIQQTQIQDIPVSQFTKQVALQQAAEVFVPAHDAYSLGKIFAARPSGNVVALDVTKYPLSFSQLISKSKTGGASPNNIVAWVTYDFADILRSVTNFTGSDAGYADGKNGLVTRMAGSPIVSVPTSYFFAGVYGICVDKRAVINVTPKMDPKTGGMKVITDVPGFSGVELQMRDRSDTFVLNKKARTVASLEIAGSTTTTTASS